MELNSYIQQLIDHPLVSGCQTTQAVAPDQFLWPWEFRVHIELSKTLSAKETVALTSKFEEVDRVLFPRRKSWASGSPLITLASLHEIDSCDHPMHPAYEVKKSLYPVNSKNESAWMLLDACASMHTFFSLESSPLSTPAGWRAIKRINHFTPGLNAGISDLHDKNFLREAIQRSFKNLKTVLESIHLKEISPSSLNLSYEQWVRFHKIWPWLVHDVSRHNDRYLLRDPWTPAMRMLAARLIPCLKDSFLAEWLGSPKEGFTCDSHLTPVLAPDEQTGWDQESCWVYGRRIPTKTNWHKSGPPENWWTVSQIGPRFLCRDLTEFKTKCDRTMINLFRNWPEGRSVHGEWSECSAEVAEVAYDQEYGAVIPLGPLSFESLKNPHPKTYLRLKSPHELRHQKVQDTLEVIRPRAVLDVGGRMDSGAYRYCLRSRVPLRIVNLEHHPREITEAGVDYQSQDVLEVREPHEDTLILTEVLEHWPEEFAERFARWLEQAKAIKFVLLTTPNRRYEVFPGVLPYFEGHVVDYDRETLLAYVANWDGFEIREMCGVGGTDRFGEPVSWWLWLGRRE